MIQPRRHCRFSPGRTASLGLGFIRAVIVGLCLATPVSAPAEPVAALAPGSDFEIEIGANSSQEYLVTLPQGTAADLFVTQRAGFVDLAIRGDSDATLKLRTESGIGGSMAAPLVASKSAHWLITVAPRTGKRAGSVTVRLSMLRQATAADESRSAGFEHYVEAEHLRFANYRETVADARSADVNDRTRGAYRLAESAYAAAHDACGLLRVRIGLSRMEVTLGNYAEARSMGVSALEENCETDLAERAQALKTIGMAAAYQGDLAASTDAAEQALALYRRTGDLRYQGVVLGNLSSVYMQLGATDQGLAAAFGALRAAETTTDSQGVVFGRKSIADIYLARGELASALREYRGTLDTLAVTPYPMIEGETWNDLGIVYHRMADYEQSLKAYAKAQAVWKQMSSRVGEANTLIDKAETLLELGRHQAAVRELAASLSIARADGLKSTEARALRGLGAAQLGLNRRAEARGYFRQSLDIARATGAVAAESYALRGIGEVEYQGRQWAAARRDEEAALKLAQQAVDRDGEVATRAQLARMLAARGLLEDARSNIDAAMSIIETQRGLIDDPSLRTSYFASMRAYPDTQIDILMRLDEKFPTQGYAVQALAAAEKARARSLQDMFKERSINVSANLAPDLGDELRRAEERVRVAAVRLAQSTAATERGQLQGQSFDAASHELDEIRGRVRAANRRYADLVQPEELNIGAVQRTLIGDDVAILAYWLGPRQSYLWIVTHGVCRAMRLPRRSVIEHLSGELGQLLRAHDRGAAGKSFEGLAGTETSEAAALRGAAQGLAAALLPAAALRGLPRKVAVVADGQLQDLPFGVLHLSAEDASFGAAHDLSYLPSIATLAWLRRESSTTRSASLAIFAAPVLAASGSAAPSGDDFASLPYSLIEAQSIADLVPTDRVWLAVGPEASRANVLAADWRRFTIVHFATHAIADARRPEMSGVVLSMYNANGGPQDGVVRMNDIYNLDMPVDLVVLSGCATAAGRDVVSEGPFSLSRAFFYAGAPRVLASLWTVDDRATATFMREFYTALLVEHMSAASALRSAQQQLARDKRWSSPYYWAAFVLQGDWE